MSNVSVSQSWIDGVSRERQEMLRKLDLQTEQLQKKDATINALADALERLWNFSVPRAKTEALWPEVESALQKAGRLP